MAEGVGVVELHDAAARPTAVCSRPGIALDRELFLTQGYAATTIDAIAAAAHVSRRTVFNAVGGKVVLLKLALEWAIVGDDEPVPLADRPAWRARLRPGCPAPRRSSGTWRRWAPWPQASANGKPRTCAGQSWTATSTACSSPSGWTPAAFAQWLSDSLAATLLRPS
jgi:hypothetical protein